MTQERLNELIATCERMKVQETYAKGIVATWRKAEEERHYLSDNFESINCNEWLDRHAENEKLFKSVTMKESPRNGVNTRSPKFKRMMESLGFRWTATSGIGSHQAVHFIQGELPEGRLVCSVHGHNVAVVDNQVRDIFDCRRNIYGEDRRIYGYWKKED